jgi:ribosome-associated translation inhibitor RaiA
MKLNLRFIGARAKSVWANEVAQKIKRLETVAAISVANVALEQRREMKPHFRLRILLAVPGPDIHAEATEHTFQAALLKVVNELRRQIQTRRANRLRGRHHQPLRNSPALRC